MNNSQFAMLEDLSMADRALSSGIFYADAFVNKNYLMNLQECTLAELDPEMRNDEALRFFQIERVVYDMDEFANDKLISIYSALFNIFASAILVIHSTATETSFYLGIRSTDNPSTAAAILENSFKGNFPGSQIEEVSRDEIEEILGEINYRDRFGSRQNVASVSIVPSMRSEDRNNYVQGIEKLIDTMKGSEYTAVLIADPVGKHALERHRNGLQELYTGLSPYATTQLSYGVNYSMAVAKGVTESLSKTLSRSITDTNSTSETISESTSHTTGGSSSSSRSYNEGSSSSSSSGSSYSEPDGYGSYSGSSGSSSSSSSGSSYSSSTSTNYSDTTSASYSTGTSWAHAVTEGVSETSGASYSSTDTETRGDTRTVTITNENRTVKYLLEKIDQHLMRIKNCEAFGLWDVGCYFISENVQTSVVAASTFKALMAGYDSGVEASYVNIWERNNKASTPGILDYIRYCLHPRFVVPGTAELFLVEDQIVTPCSLVSGNEMPCIMGLPRHSVPGVTVLNMAEFGRNVRYSSGAPRGKGIEFGQVYHMGEKESGRVRLDLDSFRSHCFITGSTGSGKSNTTYRILDEMIENNIPFLVIEPAKGEYKRYYGALPGIRVYCTNPRFYSMLQINPFRFNEGIHVLEHLDRLIEIFNACWPLTAAMPAILKESYEQAYIKCGWDLENSFHIPNGRHKFPTFEDVLEALPEIINASAYSADSKGDYTGALVTRVKSLTNGISGRILCSPTDIDEEDLFDCNAIVDLSRVSSTETKSLLMGLLVLKLNEYRMCTSEENQPLRHITVMEEAHNILKRVNPGEGSDVQAKSVEMISAAIAEMRTYGEGFIIVDQSPTAVDASAVKNTNTKIIMRLPDYEDCRIAGLSMGLDENQIHEISRFPMGVAAVYQNNWVESVLTMIDKSEETYHQRDLTTDGYSLAKLKGQLVTEIMIEFESGEAKEDGFQLDELLEIISESDLNAGKRKELIREIVEMCFFFEKTPIKNGTVSQKLYELVSCAGLFEALPLTFTRDYSDLKVIAPNKIADQDRRKIHEWKSRLSGNLNQYVLVPDTATKERLIRYLLLHKRMENINENKYHLIYSELYERSVKKHE